MTVRLEGSKKLRKELRAAGMDMGDLRAVFASAARIVETAARWKTPTRTGRLKATVRSSGTVSAGVIRAGYKSVPYANPIHWGWPARGIKAQPWISDAALRTETEWVDEFAKHMADAIDGVEGLAVA